MQWRVKVLTQLGAWTAVCLLAGLSAQLGARETPVLDAERFAQASLPELEQHSLSRGSILPVLSTPTPAPSSPAQEQRNIQLEADTLSGTAGERLHLEGRATLQDGALRLRADVLDYDANQSQARAQGSVRISREGNYFYGDVLDFNHETDVGSLTQPQYYFARSRGHGNAEKIDFLDAYRARVYGANYTTCECSRRDDGAVATAQSCSAQTPAWQFRASQVDFDQQTETGLARGVQLRFMDTPILVLPILSFPLTDKRKSGLLPPTIALDNTSGLVYTQPVYWNIAPNLDATISPSLQTQRGINLENEFRYLQRASSGEIHADFMPDDRLRGENRWGVSMQHRQDLAALFGLPAAHTFSATVDINRVSDGEYWRDFANNRAGLARRILPSEVAFAWQHRDFYARAQSIRWRAQQVAESRITPPYDQVPSLAVGWEHRSVQGFRYGVHIEQTRFESDAALQQQSNGSRRMMRAEVAYPLRRSAAYLIPKLQWQWREYALDAPSAGAKRRQLSAPTLSLDAGLAFERSTNFLDQRLIQTLEPRAFFTNTPYREQNDLPNYDSDLSDFNFTSIYTENAFTGGDRIADNRLITLGAQSRFLRLDSGEEILRLSYAQRLRLRDRRVVLPGGEADRARVSDMLFGLNASLDSRWRADALVQYNPKTAQSERGSLGLRYRAADYQNIALAYRTQRGQSEALDIGWQWPLARSSTRVLDAKGRWYSVGRLNYSIKDKGISESILGVEYEDGCWIGRVALERVQSTIAQTNQRILFQLEFVGFSRLGASPLKALQTTVPGYQILTPVVAADAVNVDDGF